MVRSSQSIVLCTKLCVNIIVKFDSYTKPYKIYKKISVIEFSFVMTAYNQKLIPQLIPHIQDHIIGFIVFYKTIETY